MEVKPRGTVSLRVPRVVGYKGVRETWEVINLFYILIALVAAWINRFFKI